MYERVLLGKRQMVPFHLNCSVTKKQICRCAFANLPQGELNKVLNRNQPHAQNKRQKTEAQEARTLPEDLAYDMHLYYMGYPITLQEHLHRKLIHEKERLMHVSDQAHAASFSRFIDSDDDSQSEYDTMTGSQGLQTTVPTSYQNQDKGVESSGLKANKCTHCKAQILDAHTSQKWKNEQEMQITLCGKCNQKYISGLVDNTSEHRKFTKQMQQILGKLSPMESSKDV